VDDVCALMERIGLKKLREVFLSNEVSGLLLSYCETGEDLQAPEYGVTNKGIAKGLMKSINEWKEKGVPEV
jgi:hypothetical protein